MGTGENVGVAGFIIPGRQAKKVVVRGIGPSLRAGDAPVEGRLEKPVLELFDANREMIDSNDNWKDRDEQERGTLSSLRLTIASRRCD